VPRDPAGTATITVTQEGTMAWDKDPVTLDEFLVRLKSSHVEHPDDARVLINGDADASYSSVIYALDEVRKGDPEGADRDPGRRSLARPEQPQRF
jgi:biopolymer transport protein ExbD